jgi:hypothetical protein
MLFKTLNVIQKKLTLRTQAMQLKMTVEAAKERALELMYRGYH